MGRQVRVRRYKYVYSPCYMSEAIDRAIHKTLPKLLRAYADKLERTSPRWGWRAKLEQRRRLTWQRQAHDA